jgi:transposase
LAVYRDRGYAQGRGVGQPEADRCALACAFLAKAVLDLKTTRALIDRLQADSKLRRLCGFDLRFALPSEATFSRAFDEFSSSELMQRVHARMIEDTLGEQLIGHISRDATAIEARESIAKKDKTEAAW